MSEQPRHTTIVGVGNQYRGDDGVGLVVARRLKERLGARANVCENNGDGAALLEALRGASRVIIVDAAKSGDQVGTIHRFDAKERKLTSDVLHCSTHAFGVSEAIELARALGELPATVIIYAVEGESFEQGEELSLEVSKAVEEVVSRIRAEVS